MQMRVDEQSPHEADFVAMTAEQARAYRQEHATLSPWTVVRAQLMVGVTVAGLAWLVTLQREVAASVACGAMAVVLPAALFARGLMGRFASMSIGNAVTGFFLWELVKIVMTVAVMLMAHRWVSGLNWPAMLVGLVLTMKVYWLALLFKGQRKPAESN
ncbi:MAG: ATP synthase subunit I [Betaproteobacteria bacterium]